MKRTPGTLMREASCSGRSSQQILSRVLRKEERGGTKHQVRDVNMKPGIRYFPSTAPTQRRKKMKIKYHLPFLFRITRGIAEKSRRHARRPHRR